MAKKKTIKETVKELIAPEGTAAIEKNVVIKISTATGEIPQAIIDINAEIAKLAPDWEAGPIEFTKLNNTMLQVTANFRKNGQGNAMRIKCTKDPQKWEFTRGGNHPVISFGADVYYLGIK